MVRREAQLLRSPGFCDFDPLVCVYLGGGVEKRCIGGRIVLLSTGEGAHRKMGELCGAHLVQRELARRRQRQ